MLLPNLDVDVEKKTFTDVFEHSVLSEKWWLKDLSLKCLQITIGYKMCFKNGKCTNRFFWHDRKPFIQFFKILKLFAELSIWKQQDILLDHIPNIHFLWLAGRHTREFIHFFENLMAQDLELNLEIKEPLNFTKLKGSIKIVISP